MARKTFGQGLLGKFSTYGKTLEFGDVKVLVRSASVRVAREFQAAQKAFQETADADALNDHVVTVFLQHACNPENGELAFSEEDREAVIDSIPFPVILQVVQAAVGIDTEQAAKN